MKTGARDPAKVKMRLWLLGLARLNCLIGLLLSFPLHLKSLFFRGWCGVSGRTASETAR